MHKRCSDRSVTFKSKSCSFPPPRKHDVLIACKTYRESHCLAALRQSPFVSGQQDRRTGCRQHSKPQKERTIFSIDEEHFVQPKSFFFLVVAVFVRDKRRVQRLHGAGWSTPLPYSGIHRGVLSQTSTALRLGPCVTTR